MSPRTRLNLLGAAILVIGLCVGAWIWIAQDRIDRKNNGPDIDQLSLLDSRVQTRQLEVLSGHSGVVAEQWSEGLRSLFHGKRLAFTVAILSSIAGIGCMLAADYLLPILRRGNPPS